VQLQQNKQLEQQSNLFGDVFLRLERKKSAFCHLPLRYTKGFVAATLHLTQNAPFIYAGDFLPKQLPRDELHNENKFIIVAEPFCASLLKLP
jgi:hypothetical protein